MAEKTKNAGNTKPKWFVKERDQAFVRLQKLYPIVSLTLRMVDELTMIEQYQCYDDKGHHAVNLQVYRGVDKPYSSIYKQVLIIENQEETL